MTTPTLEQRVAALERMVQELKAQPSSTIEPTDPWWLKGQGRFANDPVFDEIVRLGAEYRQSLRPSDDEEEAGDCS